MKKRFLLILLAAVCVTVFLMAVPASAAEASGICGEKLTWELENGVLTISGEGEMDHYSPEDAPWYDLRDSIVAVSIENGVTGIGEHAFADCRSMKKVTFPESLTYIGEYAFNRCKGLEMIFFTGDEPEIENYAFQDVEAVYYYPPDNDTWDGRLPVFNCKLYPVAGTAADHGTCGENLQWNYADGVLTITGEGPMNDYSNTSWMPWMYYRNEIVEAVLPEGLTAIGRSAFANCTALLRVDIPNNVQQIGNQAFVGCSALETIKIPEGVTAVGEFTFQNCASLQSVKLPDSLKSIGMHAFGYCTSLKSVTIPANVDAIYMGAFENCTSLKEVWFTGDCPEWIDMIFTNVTATVYYPAGNETWTKAKMDSTEGNITWVAHSPIDITTQPKTQKVKAGGTVKYTVKASGKGLKYQWQSSSDGKKWKNCSSTSAKKATFTFTAKTSHSSNYYRCVITDADGNKITTKEVRLYVLGITEQPTTKKVEAGEKVKFTVKATGAGKTYQWQSSSDGKTWKNCTSSSAKSATFTFTGKTSHSGNYYRCKVTDNAGNVVYTSAVRLYVLGVKTQPKAQTVKSGEKVKFTVKTTGAGKTYQWQCSTDGGKTWKNCSSSSATSATFTFTGKTKHHGNYYRCKISDNAGNVVYTNKVKLTLKK